MLEAELEAPALHVALRDLAGPGAVERPLALGGAGLDDLLGLLVLLFLLLRLHVARKDRVGHGQVVGRDRRADRGLHQVVLDRVARGVVLGVPDEAVVPRLAASQALLGPVEAGNAEAVEGGVVGGAATGHLVLDADADRHLGEALIHGCDGGGEHGLHGLGADEAALVAGAAVVDEARGDAVHLARVAQPLGVLARAVEPLLLTAPQADADRAPGLDAHRREDARGLDHDRRTRAVVLAALGAGTVPGVEVGRDDHHLIGELGARDLGDDVEDREGALGEPVDEIGLELDDRALLEALLDRGGVLLADRDSPLGGQRVHREVEPVAHAAGHDLVVAAGLQLAGDPRGLDGLRDLLASLAAVLTLLAALVAHAAPSRARVLEDPGAGEVGTHGLQLLAGGRHLHDAAAHRAIGPRRPGAGGELEVELVGGDHLHAGGTPVEPHRHLAPLPQVCVGEAVVLKATAGPDRRALETGRAGEPRPDVEAQVLERGPHLGALGALLDEGLDDLGSALGLGGGGDERQGADEGDGEAGAEGHAGLLRCRCYPGSAAYGVPLHSRYGGSGPGVPGGPFAVPCRGPTLRGPGVRGPGGQGR